MRFNIDDTPPNITSEQALQNIQITLEKLQKKSQEFKEFKTQLAQEFKTQLDVIFKEFFTLVPQIKMITWAQYTPYHMDGDTCYFYVRDVYALNFIPTYAYESYEDERDLADHEAYEEQDGNLFAIYSYSLDRNEHLNDQQKILLKNIFSVINKNDDFLEELFGDHAIVQVTANGIEVLDHSDHY